MEFRVQDSGEICPSCEWILASGPIEPGDANKLYDFIEANAPVPRNIRFLSPGGELHAALELGAFLRARGFDTFVGDSDYVHPGLLGMIRSNQRSLCYSACVYAFAGGVHRHADGNVLGIHQFYLADELLRPREVALSAGELAMKREIAARLDDYVLAMGVDPRLVAIASTVAPWGSIRLLDARELAELNLNTSSASR